MNSYKQGMALVSVKCANCAFDEFSIGPRFTNQIFASREDLFSELVKLHSEDVKVQKGIYKCTSGQLTVKFCEIAEFVTY